ncbi:ATP-binding protein [Actinoplanes philippinensis]|uniref:ATP-binding protein n=1 Tax=Actinoplanes philippinensis TaxID=35752 RepID=UPI00340E8064
MLIGREDTLREVTDLLRGPTGTALLTGIPGAGKTAVLTAVQDTWPDVRYTTGTLSDQHLPYAALAGLITDESLLDSLTGDSPHPLRLRLDVLSWLESESEKRPILIVLDDAQWCDETSLSVLGFVARRLRGTRIALLAACRDNEVPPALAGLPAVALPPLDEHDATRLLKQAGVGLTGATLLRVLDRSAGNPLALLELGRAAAARTEPTTVERAFADRLGALPPATRRILLLAAAGDGDLPTGRC